MRRLNYFSIFILFFLVFAILWIYIERQVALRNPSSCLAVKIKMRKNLRLGNTLPVCDLFGEWRPQQSNDAGGRYCVTPEGKMISGSYVSVLQEPKECKNSLIVNAYFKVIDSLIN